MEGAMEETVMEVMKVIWGYGAGSYGWGYEEPDRHNY